MPQFQDFSSSFNSLAALAEAAAHIQDHPVTYQHKEFMGRRASSVDSLPEVDELVNSAQNLHHDNPPSAHSDFEDSGLTFVPYAPSVSSNLPDTQISAPTALTLPKRGRGRPRTKSVAQKNARTSTHTSTFSVEPSPEPEEDDVPNFSVWLCILQKEKVTKTRGGKSSKIEKVPPKMLGPVQVPINATYKQFLEIVCAGIKGVQDVRQLRLDSFFWYFNQRNIHHPLQNEQNFNHLMMTVTSRKVRQEKAVYLEMLPPLQVVQQPDDHSPWESDHIVTNNSAKSVLILSQAGVEDLGTEDEQPTAKKPKLDDAIEDLVAQIQERYGPGKACQEPSHASLCCFVHHSTKQHFDVGFRPRALFWAGKIHNERSDITCIPIGEGWFKPNHALKITHPPPAPLSVAPAQSVDHSLALEIAELKATQLRYMMMMGNSSQLPHVSHASSSVSSHMLPVSQTHGNFLPSSQSPKSLSHRQSSPPMSNSKYTLSDFCEANGFDSVMEERLKNLEFQPGDDLSDVKQTDWMDAGFKLLSWKRVLKANKKYRATLKENSNM
ncbi:hypothetical protein FB446DRAFT_771365 [Lentinula raphanica]|nr:hypothetical protein FB446DRAFT_771365 [Lentinula raphanica]